MANAALRLGQFAATLSFADLPPVAVECARRHLLDTFGVAIRGQRHEIAASSLRAMATIDGAAGGIPVWGTDRRLAAGYAALVNGIAAHVLDFDDTHTDSIVHGSAIIAPVVVALGQRRDASGEDLIAAFVAGWEVAARVGLAAKGTFHQRGFHTTSIAGVFGAVAAASHLLGLSPAATAQAIGLAGSQASGINEYLSDSSSAKSLHVGWSAHAGMLAASLAQSGMTGPASVFEGRDGLLRTHGIREQVDPAALAADLGTRWEVSRISIKPYPCCHFAHAFIDCVGGLAARGVAPSDIASIECVVPEIERPLICEPFGEKLRPASPYAAKFSLPFLVASRIVEGSIGHRTFEMPNLKRADILDLAARVSYRIAAPGETPFPRTFPGWVEARLVDGRTIVERMDVNAGHPDNPLAREQVEAKFLDNAGEALGEAGAKRVVELVAELPATSPTRLAGALSAASLHVSQPDRRKAS